MRSYIVFIIWNFLEQFIIVTYLFRMYDIINPGFLIKFELVSFLIIWFIYSNFTFIFAYINKNDILSDNNIFILVSLAVLYICFIINGVIPLILSFSSKRIFTIVFFSSISFLLIFRLTII